MFEASSVASESFLRNFAHRVPSEEFVVIVGLVSRNRQPCGLRVNYNEFASSLLVTGRETATGETKNDEDLIRDHLDCGQIRLDSHS